MTTININTLKSLATALRSGKYEQGQGKLRSNHNEFCCLGVLCDLVDPLGWQEDGDEDFSRMLHRNLEVFPNETLIRDAGLGEGNSIFVTLTKEELDDLVDAQHVDFDPNLFEEEIEEGVYSVGLHVLNDAGASFDVIADLIETKIIPAAENKDN